MKVYEVPRSGNCHRARLMLGMLGIAYDSVIVDIAGGETRQKWYLAMNPRGTVPTLDDDGTVVPDSHAMLVYLARAYGSSDWLPADAAGAARVALWMGIAQGEIHYGIFRARAMCIHNRPGDLTDAQAIGYRGLDLIERGLNGPAWLAADHVTIADISCYPYVALAPEARMSLDSYPNIRGWMARVRALPGYVELPPPDPVKADAEKS